MSQNNSLRLVVGSPEEPVYYLVNGRFMYGAVTPQRINMAQISQNTREIDIGSMMEREPFVSHPVLVWTSNGFIVITKLPGRSPVSIYASASGLEDNPIIRVDQLRFPDLSYFYGQMSLPILSLAEFDPLFSETLTDASHRGESYHEAVRGFNANGRSSSPQTSDRSPSFRRSSSPGLPGVPSPSRGRSPEFLRTYDRSSLPRRSSSSSSRQIIEHPSQIDHETLGLLLRQLYGLSIEIPSFLMNNNLELPVVSFEEASRLIGSGQIISFNLDPFLQPWAGPPTGRNRMVSLISRDGSSYLVRAQYNASTGQISPPS